LPGAAALKTPGKDRQPPSPIPMMGIRQCGDGGHPGQHRFNTGDSGLVPFKGYFGPAPGGQWPALTGRGFTPSSGPGGRPSPWRKFEAALLAHQPEDPGHRPHAETCHGPSASRGGIASSVCRRHNCTAGCSDTSTSLALCPCISMPEGVERWPTAQPERPVCPPGSDGLQHGAPRRGQAGGAPRARWPQLGSLDVSPAPTNTGAVYRVSSTTRPPVNMNFGNAEALRLLGGRGLEKRLGPPSSECRALWQGLEAAGAGSCMFPEPPCACPAHHGGAIPEGIDGKAFSLPPAQPPRHRGGWRPWAPLPARSGAIGP